ncbi:LysR family transcriptional regulator [Pseudomonas sp. S25]|uniref:LysR family transcriptional regulator n=1 Tax=Pseudomonas maioricensis TaxID=1766623 RepID=A0ABS9ZQT5_9PSED|nr:LysR family transcriptional regulator [Pseudomonas sp. S25]MCI8212676.1 LysR family transcriptional regulator [Pseudomonas sp. S25]
MEFDESLFRNIDLNSLFTLLLIYREQGVSKTAELLHVKQPAVSNTLAKLRCHFHDPLFVRHAHGVKPTAKATEIIQHLEAGFQDIQNALLIAAR